MVKATVLPPPNHARTHDWAKYVDAALAQPGQPVLALKQGRLSQAKSLRQRSGPPFVTPQGRIVINTRNREMVDGVERVDIYLTWVRWGK